MPKKEMSKMLLHEAMQVSGEAMKETELTPVRKRESGASRNAKAMEQLGQALRESAEKPLPKEVRRSRKGSAKKR